MKDPGKSTEQSQEKNVTLEQLSDGVVNRKVMTEAIQQPTTLLPAAAAILSTAYMGLVSFNETTFAVAAGSALVSVISWLYHYLIRGDKLRTEYFQRLVEKRSTIKEKKSVDVEAECVRIGFREGAEAARELKDAYVRLSRFLSKKKREGRTATAERFAGYAEENYEKGIYFLTKGLALYKALKEMQPRKLNRELESWQDDLQDMQKRRGKEGDHVDLTIQALEKKIESHERRIDLYQQRIETLRQVLALCEIQEASLDSAYLDLVDLLEDEFDVKMEHVVGNLEKSVHAARRAADRMRHATSGNNEDDDIYLQAGRDKE